MALSSRLAYHNRLQIEIQSIGYKTAFLRSRYVTRLARKHEARSICGYNLLNRAVWAPSVKLLYS